MGYNGLGMQRWIYTMKPRKFFEKRSKPDGGGGESELKSNVESYYHLEKNNLENLNHKSYPYKYKLRLRNRIKIEAKKQKRYFFVSFVIALLLLFVLIWFLNNNFDLL